MRVNAFLALSFPILECRLRGKQVGKFLVSGEFLGVTVLC